MIRDSSVARTVGPAFDYRLRWTWMAPMVAFVVVAWAAWLAAIRWRPATSPWLVFGAVVVLVGVSSVNMATAAEGGHPREGDADVVATIGPPVLEAVGGGDGDRVVLVTEPFHQAAVYARGLAWYLERHDVDVRVEPTLALHFGEHRAYDGEPVDAVLRVMSDSGIETAVGNPDLSTVAEWETESIGEWYEMRQARADLERALASGAINDTEYVHALAELPRPTSSVAYAYRVTVLLDERRPVEPHIGVGHNPIS